MNTLAGVNYTDVYEEERAAIHAKENDPHAFLNRLRAEIAEPQATENQLPGSQNGGNLPWDKPISVVKNSDGTTSTVRTTSVNIDNKEVLIPTVSPDGRVMSDAEAVKSFQTTGRNFGSYDTVEEANTAAEKLHEMQSQFVPVADQPSDEYVAEEKKKSLSVINTLTWATSPLMALGDFATAPMGDQNYPGTGFTDDTIHAFKVGGKAFLDRLLPKYGEEITNHGEAVVEKHLPEAPGWLKPVLATGVELVADPTVSLGLGAAKIFQEGMRVKKLQALGEEPLTNKGIWEEGIGKLLGLDGAIKDDELTRVGQLAAKADRGDREAFGELQNVMQDQRIVDLTKAADFKAATNVIDDYKRSFGDKDAPMLVFDKAEKLGKEHKDALKAGLESGRVPDFAGNINLAKLNTPEDVDILLNEIHTRFKPVFDAAVGPAHTDAKVQKGVGMQTLEDLLGRKPQYFDDSQALALRQALVMSGNTFRKMAITAKQTGSELDKLAANKAFFVNLLIQQKATGVASEAGRLLRSFQIDAGNNWQMARQVKALIEDKTGLDSHALRVLNELAIDDSMDSRQLQRFLDKSTRTLGQKAFDKTAKGYDVFYEAFVNAVLSGPLTHAVNITSNTAMLALRPSEKYLESLSAASRLDISQAGRSLKEANAMIAGLVGGVNDAFRIATGRATKSQVNYPEELMQIHELARQRVKPQITSENLGMQGRIGALVDFLGNMIRMPGEALMKEDKAFKLINYRMSINQEAAKRAAFIGNSSADSMAIYRMFRNNPDEFMKERAIDLSSVYTFTNRLEGKLGDWEKALRTPGVNLIIPFFRTPMNITKFGARHSIVGNAFKDVAIGDILRKTPKGDLARAKFAVGTMLPMSLVAMLDDRITGGGDMKTEKGRFKAEFDAPPYSVRIGEKWVSYERIEPIRTILGVVTNYRDAWLAAEDIDDKEEIWAVTVAPFIEAIGDNAFFEVFGNLHWILDGVRNDDYTGVVERLEKIGSAVAVPNIISQSNQMAFDDKFRMSEGILEDIKKRTWGISKELPIRPNAFGEPQYVPRGIALAEVNPFLTRDVKHDIVANEMVRLNVDIPKLPKDFSINGIKIALSTQQRSDYGVLVGKGIEGEEGLPPMRDLLKQIMASEQFKKKPDFLKKDIIEFQYQNRRENVKRYMVQSGKYPELTQQYEDVKLAQEESARQGAAQ